MFQVVPPNGIYALNASTAGASDPQCVRFGALGSADLGNATCATGSPNRAYLQPRTLLLLGYTTVPTMMEWPSGLPLTAMPTAFAPSSPLFLVVSTLRYLYVLGGMGDFRNATSVARYDAILDVWTGVAPMSQPHNQGTAVAAAGGDLLVFGGYADADDLVMQMVVERFSKGVWKNESVLPAGVDQVLGAVMIGATCYVVADVADQLVVYSYLRQVWKPVASRPVWYQVTVATALGRIYIFDVNNSVPVTYYYDPGTAAWTNVVPPSPMCSGDVGRVATTMFATIYISCMVQASQVYTLYTLTALTGAWTAVPIVNPGSTLVGGIGHVALPVVPVRRTTTTSTTTPPPATTTSTTIPDVLLVVGGYGVNGAAVATGAVWTFDANISRAPTLTLAISPMNTPRALFAYTMFAGEFYVFGGNSAKIIASLASPSGPNVLSAGAESTLTVEKFTPNTNTWTRLPALSQTTALYHAVTVTAGILLVGGFGTEGSNIIAYSSVSTDRATTALGEFPSDLSFVTSAVALNDVLYLLGLSDGDFTVMYACPVLGLIVGGCVSINAAQNTDTLAETVFGVTSGCLVAFNNMIVYVYDSLMGYWTVDVYNPVTQSWLYLLVPGFPENAVNTNPRVAVVLNNMVVVMHGGVLADARGIYIYPNPLRAVIGESIHNTGGGIAAIPNVIPSLRPDWSDLVDSIGQEVIAD